MWQKLLARMRPTVQGQNRRYSARFRTSDVLQESAIQIIGEMENSGEDHFDPPQAWLRKVGRGHASKLREHHAAQKRTAGREVVRDVQEITVAKTADDVVEQQELTGRLVLYLAKLDADQRTIIDLHFTKQHSFAEIARQMKRPPEWVRRQYKKAISQLRTMLGDDVEE